MLKCVLKEQVHGISRWWASKHYFKSFSLHCGEVETIHYTLIEWSLFYNAQYHKQQCTFHKYEQFETLYMHRQNDNMRPKNPKIIIILTVPYILWKKLRLKS